MTETSKSESGTTSTSPDTPLKQPTKDGSVKPGIGNATSDWNPNQKPSDDSPVLTAIPQYKPMAGQTGAKPKTVAQHNAEVLELAEARRSGKRSEQW